MGLPRQGRARRHFPAAFFNPSPIPLSLLRDFLKIQVFDTPQLGYRGGSLFTGKRLQDK